jgi:hypothetical protein
MELFYLLAVAVGADCIMNGRMLTTAGAIAFGPGTITTPQVLPLLT